jgi:hypothetical protein
MTDKTYDISEVTVTGKATCKNTCYGTCNTTYQPGYDTSMQVNAANQSCRTSCDTKCAATTSTNTATDTCSVCKEKFCANETVSCSIAKAEAACESQCKKTTDMGDETVMGITMGPTCLKNGQCGFNIYELLGFNKSSSPTLFVQDILLSATFFIGTVITLAFIYSGILFVFAGATGKDPSNAKSGIKYSIIGLLIVICSYSLIRLVQYIAKGF